MADRSSLVIEYTKTEGSPKKNSTIIKGDEEI